MLKIRIIPCLDVDAGRVVKGVNFVDLVDAGDPVEQARIYDRAGADELCFLDITASHQNRDTLLDVVKGTAEQCFMPLTVGGGVRTIEDFRKLLLAGADKVSLNTAAVEDPDLVAKASARYGNQCIDIGLRFIRIKLSEFTSQNLRNYYVTHMKIVVKWIVEFCIGREIDFIICQDFLGAFAGLSW